jgi:hypothetical protein
MLPATGAYHILRHTFCSHLAMQGATAKAIQELAGHQDLATTQRYKHLSPARGRRDPAPRPAAGVRGSPRLRASFGDDTRGRAGKEQDAPSAVRAASVGDGLETTLRSEPEPNRLG